MQFEAAARERMRSLSNGVYRVMRIGCFRVVKNDHISRRRDERIKVVGIPLGIQVYLGLICVLVLALTQAPK